MKRIKSLIFLAGLFMSLAAYAETFVPGTDYQIVSEKPLAPAGKVNVTEFFSYGCPWCYRLDTPLNLWVKQHEHQINFSRVPVVFHKEWETYAKAFYTLQQLHLESQLSPALFKAIAEKPQAYTQDDTMIALLTAQGVDKATATSAFTHSLTLEMALKEGNLSMARYYINAVPAFVVNGMYKTDLQMAKNQTRLFEILDFLITEKLPVVQP